MDKYNVIVPTDNLADLNNDITQWSMMPFDLRKKSDDDCIRMYGCTNKDLYEKTKAKILFYKDLADKEESNLSESAMLWNYDNLQDKLAYSNQLQQSPFIVILDPTISSIEELNDRMNLFISLSDKDKRLSDSYSMEIWKYNVYNMYTLIKNSLETEDVEEDTVSDNLLSETYREKCLLDGVYDLAVYNLYSHNILEYTLLVNNIYNQKNDNEKDYYASYKYEKLCKEKAIYDTLDSSILPDVCPWLTPEEMRRNKFVFEAETFGYRNLINCDESELTKYGWTKYYKPNLNTLKEARERLAKKLNTNIIDVSNIYQYIDETTSEGYDYTYCPLLIIFNYPNKSDNKLSFNKAGIMVDDKIYTMRNADSFNGFTIESISDYANVEIYAIYVTSEAYDIIMKYLSSGELDLDYDPSPIYNTIIANIKNPMSIDAIKVVITKYVDILYSIIDSDTKAIESNKIFKVFSGNTNEFNYDNIYKIMDIISNNDNRNLCIENMISKYGIENNDIKQELLKTITIFNYIL